MLPRVAVFSFVILLYFSLARAVQINDEAIPERIDLKTIGFEIRCKFQPNTYICGDDIRRTSRFYYDLKMKECKTFSFGYCPNSYNNFNVLKDCYEACKDDGEAKLQLNLTENIYCRLQPDFGDCHDYNPMWYFDIGERLCKGFSYSGCGGNQNRFENKQLCATACAKAIEY